MTGEFPFAGTTKLFYRCLVAIHLVSGVGR